MSLAVAKRCAIAALAAALMASGFVVVPQQTIAAAAAPSEGDLVIVGTVTDIHSQPASHSLRNWVITVHVEKVTTGHFSGATFSFTVHSPAKAGLVVGRTYNIRATWKGQGYEVDETQWQKPGAAQAGAAG